MSVLRWSCSSVARFGLIALVTLVWSSRPVEAQQQCAPQGRTGGGMSSGAQSAAAAGLGLSAAGAGTTPFLVQEFFAQQQSQALNLQRLPGGRSMPVMLGGTGSASRSAALRPLRSRRRSDREAIASRRRLALQLSRERQLKEAAEAPEDETEETADVAPEPDPFPVPEIFAVKSEVASDE